MIHVARWILTGALLVEVCFHAHWSVALCLALQALATELMVFNRNPQAGRWDTP